MNYNINTSILNENFLSYSKDNNLSDKFIDCYDGVNNLTFSSIVNDNFFNLDISCIKNYPRGNNLKKSIINYWPNLNINNIVLTDGSIYGIYLCNKLFLKYGDKVLGIAPQFPEYAMDVKINGCRFDYYTLNSKNNFEFDENEFIKLINKSYKLIYVDNPNNPTGQIIPLSKITKIVEVAKKNNIAIIVDEAYGDYMSKDNSAINLIHEFDNIIILKTFSKFFAMPGIRAGYIVSPHNFYDYLNKISHPYCINEIGRQLCSLALNDTKFIQDTISITKKIKSKFMKQWKNICISSTHNNVPIFLIYHKKLDINLEYEFSKFNIGVVNGCSYISLNKNFARIRIPKKEFLDEVLKSLEYIDIL